MVRLRKVDPEVYRVAGFFKSPLRKGRDGFFYSNGVAVVPAPENKTEQELLEMVYTKGEWVENRWSGSADRLIRKKDEVAVRFTAPLFDGSGYAEAARNYVAALHTEGVPVYANSVTFEPARSNYGKAGKITEACRKQRPFGFNLIMMTPDYFHRHHEPSAYNIGIFLWETNKLPKEWVPACNQMDEIWVCCQWNAEVAKQSGVKVPIRVYGCTTSEESSEHVPLLNVPGLDPNAYKFYSIFQWTERKNPKGLLMAYLTAFTKKDNVALILKTYRSSYSQGERNAVAREIEKVKEEVGGDNLPPVYFVSWMLTKQEILGLHKLGDCFALIHRSEGWGMPHHEACLAGKPCITTNFGGNLDFNKPDNSYLVGYKMAKVEGMPHIPWYRSDMLWSSPNVPECRDLMRHVFTHREEASEKGRRAQAFVRENLSWSAIGGAMKARLQEIHDSLQL